MPEYLHRCEHGRILERERCPECRPQQPTEADRERARAFIRAAADEFITDESLAALLAAVRREAVEAERERCARPSGCGPNSPPRWRRSPDERGAADGWKGDRRMILTPGPWFCPTHGEELTDNNGYCCPKCDWTPGIQRPDDPPLKMTHVEQLRKEEKKTRYALEMLQEMILNMEYAAPNSGCKGKVYIPQTTIENAIELLREHGYATEPEPMKTEDVQ